MALLKIINPLKDVPAKDPEENEIYIDIPAGTILESSNGTIRGDVSWKENGKLLYSNILLEWGNEDNNLKVQVLDASKFPTRNNTFNTYDGGRRKSRGKKRSTRKSRKSGKGRGKKRTTRK